MGFLLWVHLTVRTASSHLCPSSCHSPSFICLPQWTHNSLTKGTKVQSRGENMVGLITPERVLYELAVHCRNVLSCATKLTESQHFPIPQGFRQTHHESPEPSPRFSQIPDNLLLRPSVYQHSNSNTRVLASKLHCPRGHTQPFHQFS